MLRQQEALVSSFEDAGVLVAFRTHVVGENYAKLSKGDQHLKPTHLTQRRFAAAHLKSAIVAVLVS